MTDHETRTSVGITGGSGTLTAVSVGFGSMHGATASRILTGVLGGALIAGSLASTGGSVGLGDSPPTQATPTAITGVGMDLAEPVPGPRWLDYVLGRLDALAEGDGDVRPSPLSRDRALIEAVRLFDDSTTSPSVVPSDDGGVMFVWHQAGLDVILTVEDDESTIWGRQRASDTTFFGTVDEKSQGVRTLLQLLTD